VDIESCAGGPNEWMVYSLVGGYKDKNSFYVKTPWQSQRAIFQQLKNSKTGPPMSPKTLSIIIFRDGGNKHFFNL